MIDPPSLINGAGTDADWTIPGIATVTDLPEGIATDLLVVFVHLPNDISEPISRTIRRLPKDEQGRASGMGNSERRLRFLQCRVLLRLLLGRYLAVDFYTESFAYGQEGKPKLQNGLALPFNVAHSTQVAVFAFGSSRHQELGVDVEMLRHQPRAEAMAARYFTRTEYRAIASLPEGEKDRAFLRLWTRKEACIKAVGASVEGNLSSFSVLDNAHQPRIVGPGGSAVWVFDLPMESQAMAAIACTERPESIGVAHIVDVNGLVESLL